MQPLGYLAARLLLSCFQAFERHERAFVGSEPLLLAAGVGHCWAVAYSLILSLAMQASRLAGGRDYMDKLPDWVFKAEQLALLSGLVWWLASTAMFLVRAVKLDDGCQGLPMNIHDASINWLVTLVQSRTLYQVLGAAHVVSCFGNFFSIVQLCFAIVWMGGASLHEACLTLVAFGFAAPHAALAAERVASEWQQRQHFKGDGAAAACVPASAGSGVVLAVASEAAALGPQLTVVLACADATAEEVPFWQCATSVVAVAAYASSLIACGAAPPRRRGAVSPPSLSELWASLAVDVLAAATLVLSFFHLASWQWWLLLAIFAALLASISLGPVRVLLVELVEPIMPLLDGGDKARPPTGPRRELSRQLARAAVALCAAASFRSSWGRWAALRGAAVATPPPPAWADHEGAGIRSDDPGDNVMMDEGAWNDHHFSDYGDMPYDDDDRDYFTDWSAEDLLLLKWRDSHDGEAMGAAADALGIKENDLIVRDSLPQHRLLLFEVRARARELLPEGGPALAWRRVSAAPSERLSAIAEAGFPPALDAALCERLSEREWDETDLSAADAEILSGALSLTDRAVLLAYAGACAAWRSRHIHDPDSFRDYQYGDDSPYHADEFGGAGILDDRGGGGGPPPEPAEAQGELGAEGGLPAYPP